MELLLYTSREYDKALETPELGETALKKFKTPSRQFKEYLDLMYQLNQGNLKLHCAINPEEFETKITYESIAMLKNYLSNWI